MTAQPDHAPARPGPEEQARPAPNPAARPGRDGPSRWQLECWYPSSEPLVTAGLPPGTTEVLCRTAFGGVTASAPHDGVAVLSGLPAGTHAIECRSETGALIAEELTTIGASPADGPVMGFATSLEPGRVGGVVSWLGALRCSVVQIYDWMQRYSAPAPESERYLDPLGRPLHRSSLLGLVKALHELGAVAQAYAPVCAADPGFAAEHSDWSLRRNDGAPQALGDLLDIMDPANPGWQQHWLAAYGAAVDAIGFDGFHLDTYGYPRAASDSSGRPVEMAGAYCSFVSRVREAFPAATLSFNQVNGVPARFGVPPPPAFRYVEVWPPNDAWRHLEALLGRSAGPASSGGVLALYPPVWGGERGAALRTVALCEAVTTMLGAGVLVLGDDGGALRHPYYPDYERLERAEREQLLEWHRFALRCRDLFRQGPGTSSHDTSWVDVGDENGAVRVVTDGPQARPEPAGGGLFARVVRDGPLTAVACLDLTGSSGSWQEPTWRGTVRQARVELLVERPERCHAEVAALGSGGGRFAPVELVPASHREGRAVAISMPLGDGWAVARIDEGR